jgi:hypothetical protein
LTNQLIFYHILGRLVMTEQNQGYRKKQAYLVLLVFVCIGVAIWGHSAPVAVVAILAACGLSFYASTMEPEKKPDEHHH